MNELAEIISRNEDKIRSEWVKGMAKSVQRADLISKTELEEQCRSLLSAVVRRRASRRPHRPFGIRLEHRARVSAGDLRFSRAPGIFALGCSDVCSFA